MFQDDTLYKLTDLLTLVTSFCLKPPPCWRYRPARAQLQQWNVVNLRLFANCCRN